MDVALNFRDGDRPLGKLPVGVKDRVERIFPTLIGKPLFSSAPILGEAVIIDVGRAIDPIQGRFNHRPQFGEQSVITGALRVQSREQNKQGRGIDAAIIKAERNLLQRGCLAATQRRGEWAILGYVVAMMVGAAAHIGEATVNGAEIFVALSVIVLGVVLLRREPPRMDIAIALFAFAGLVHGYALGESIAGAERAPLYAYFLGLAAIQAAIALAVMYGARILAARATNHAAIIRSTLSPTS